MGERATGSDRQLARDHSVLLEERLGGFFGAGDSHGATSFAGLLSGQHPTKVNEYASLAGTDDDMGGSCQQPLSRLVSSISRMLPSGVQLEPKPIDVQMPPPAPRAALQPPQPRQQQQQADQRLHGWLDLELGRKQQQQLPQQNRKAKPSSRGPSPALPTVELQLQAHAEPVPGKPLKIRLRIPRVSSEQRAAPPTGQQQQQAPPRSDQHQMLQAVRQLGADPLLSPIPAFWAETMLLSPSREQQQQAAVASAAAAMQQQRAAVAVALAGKEAQPPFATVLDASVVEEMASTNDDEQQQQAQQPQRMPAPPQPARGTKRPAEAAGPPEAAAPAAAAEAALTKCQRFDGVAAVQAAEAAAVQHILLVRRNAGVPTAAVAGPGSPRFTDATSNLAPSTAAATEEAAPTPQCQHTAVPMHPAVQRQLDVTRAAEAQTVELMGGGGTSAGGLGALAVLLPAVLNGAARANVVPASTTVAELQKEGKKLKKFAEKRMKDGKPTHVSSMFLCQSCVKFLEVASTMEAYPGKFSRENTASMYSQTASLLDSCANNSSRAEGPWAITQALELLAWRLAAVARLRATNCLQAEGMQQVAAFRAALEKGSGETYQRPSPTDSNTSTSISLPLEAGSGKQQMQQQLQPAAGSSTKGFSVAAVSDAGSVTPAVLLVGMPKPLLERQLLAAQHSQAVLQALAVFGKSSEKLREYMSQVAAQSNVQGLKAAAATLLLSADAGMGPAGSILSLGKDALDAIMKM